MTKNIRIRQWGLLALVIAFVLTVAFGVAWFATKDQSPKTKQAKTESIRLTPEKLNEDHFVSTYGAQMLTLRDEVKRLQTELAQQKKRQDAFVAEYEPAVDPLGDPFANAGNVSEMPLAGTTLKVKPKKSHAQPVKRLTITKVSTPEVPPKVETTDKKDVPVAKNRAFKERARDLIPSGTFARAVLLNGVEAPTGGQANGNPMPLLLELTDKAVLPNRFRSDIQRCFVTANATGDLSSERVLIRLDRLSCLDETGGAVDVKLTGYVAGEDGKTGLRARVVTRSGQAIANALLVGTLSGLGDAVSLAAQESSTNFAGTVTTTVKNPWKSGLGEGMKDAMDRIADYYLRLADKIFPVLEIDAGRQVDIVVTQSASIEREMP